MTKNTFDDIRKHAVNMQSGLATRNSMYEELEDMYMLEDDTLPGEDWIKKTISPSARNALIGAVRLLSAADPEWSVPYNRTDYDAQKASSKMENFAAGVWDASGRIFGKPVHYNAVLAALLYGEVHLSIKMTQGIVDAMPSGAMKDRAIHIAGMTPVLFEVLPTPSCYPEFDGMGSLAAHYFVQKMKVEQITTVYGDAALKVLGKDADRITEVTLCEYWNETFHAVWTEGSSDPIMLEEHKLPYIPITCAITEGSELFTRPGQMSRQPFLYSLWKTQLWKRQNLGLTLMNSLAFAIGANPLFIYKRSSPEAELNVDYSLPGGLIKLNLNEEYTPLAKGVIDPSIQQVMEITQSLSEESTIYKQSLGQPMGGNAPFSMVALLSQAGRLPLVSYQRICSWVIGSAMSTALRMLKKEGKSELSVFGKSGKNSLKKSDIPEAFEITANLDISMPQDDRQNAAIAIQLAGSDNPMVSKRFARENYLNIGQSDDMQEEIWGERVAEMRYSVESQKEMIKLQAQQQQLQQQAQAQQAQQPQPGQPGQAPEQPQPGGALGLGGNQVGMPAEAMTQPQMPQGEPPMPGQAPGEGGIPQ
jgi:hypothetical protein